MSARSTPRPRQPEGQAEGPVEEEARRAGGRDERAREAGGEARCVGAYGR